MLGGLMLLATGLLPYPLVRAAGDHLSRHGRLTSLTPARFALLRPYLLGLGGLLVALSAASLAFWRHARPWRPGFGRRCSL